jgi:hypothetical protein
MYGETRTIADSTTTFNEIIGIQMDRRDETSAAGTTRFVNDSHQLLRKRQPKNEPSTKILMITAG